MLDLLLAQTSNDRIPALLGGRTDPTRAYALHLPSGRQIALFFYDGPISRAVAFEGLLDRGEHLADRLLVAFSGSRTWPQLVHIATDGESYGHHHHHGDMALAGHCYRNLLTGEVLDPSGQRGTAGLSPAAVCSSFPVALLLRVRE